MISVRMTNELRDRIVNNAIAHKLDKREAKHKDTEDKLGRALLKAKLGIHAKLLDELPPGWLRSKAYLCVTGPGGEYLTLRLSENVQMPEFVHSSHRGITVTRDHKLCPRLEAWLTEGEAIKTERAELHAKVRGLVYSASTTGRLLEIWPECSPFIPKGIVVERSLPAIIISDLNKELGLPIKSMAA